MLCLFNVSLDSCMFGSLKIVKCCNFNMNKGFYVKILLITLANIMYNVDMCAQVKLNYIVLSENQVYNTYSVRSFNDSIIVSGKQLSVKVYPEIKYQIMKGIGGAFNEQGGDAYMGLSVNKKKELVDALFDSQKGAGFTFCRTSIGASDFSFDAYSYSEKEEDYEMKYFSVERDKQSVIPFIKDGIKVNPQLTLFASPWSPPGWMKESGRMDLGKNMKEKNVLKDDSRIYAAYALYMLKYLQSYEDEGINIERLLIQNEQDFSTNYPSCRFPIEQLNKFVSGYLLPLFKKENSKTEIWAGTFRSAGELEFLKFAANKDIRKNFVGLGIQYMLPNYLTEIYQLYPNAKLMHTEGKCYNGDNSIKQAMERFEDITNYINGGCTNFCYWNMVLNEEQKSAWGWKQNSLITVNRKTQEIVYNPDYAVFLLMGKYIRPGIRRIACTSSGPCMAFVDKKGNIYVFLQNKDKEAKGCNIDLGEKKQSIILPPESLCVVEIVL